jgi:hypothetical protein
LPDISKINALAITSVSKVDGLAKASILDIDGVAVPSATGFLVDYPGAQAAYSVRQLLSTVTVAMRVRRDTAGGTGDGDEADVAFDTSLATPTISLDSAISNASAGVTATTLGQFINVGTVSGTTYTNPDSLTVTASCFAGEWKDQSGNSNHATQSAQGSQPQIHSGTVDTDLITLGGKPALEWDNQSNENFNIVGLTMTNKTVAMVFEPLGATSRALSSYAGSGSVGDEILIDRNVTTIRYFDGGLNTSATGATASRALIYAYRNASEIGIAFDGGSFATASTPNSNANTNDISIGEDNGGGAAEPPGYHQEVILWNADYSVTNRTGIETNINGFFGIY